MADKGIKRKRSFEETEENWGKYKKLWDNAPVGYHILDKNGVIIKANKTEAKMLGYKVPEMIGRPIFSFIAPAERKDVKENIERIMSGQKTGKIYSRAYQKKDGSKIYISSDQTIEIDKNGGAIRLHSTLQDVTENKKLHDKLEWAKNHYELVIDTISDGICVIDKNYKVISANKFFAQKVNRPVETLRGRNFKELINEYDKAEVKNFSCRICDKNKCIIDRTFNNGLVSEEICKTTNKHNQPRYYHLRTFPSRNKNGEIFQCVIKINDVTESVLVQKEIERLNEFNQKILDNTPVSIFIVNKRGRITSTNKMAQRLIGEFRNKAVGRSMLDVLNIKNKTDLINYYKALFKKGDFFQIDNFIFNQGGKDKNLFLNLIGAPLFDKDGNVEGAIFMTIDNTESVAAKQALELLNNELEKRISERTLQLDRINKELSKALDLKSRFIANASHELRTPLTIIKGNLDLAMKSAKNKKGENYEVYNLISKEIDHITNILTGLTLLTGGDAMIDSIKYERVNLSTLIKAAGNSLKVLAGEKNIKIIIKKVPAKLEIMGDEDKLEKLLLNLLRNAIKYGRNKGWVKIWVENKGKQIKMNVQDNGIGISEKDQPYIFERFYRADQVRATGEGGSGLGLSICKWIVEAHGGFVNVESKLGVGTLFTVNLFKDFKNLSQNSLL